MDNHSNPDHTPAQISQASELLEELFGGQLAGLYLYGSATLGRLQPDSDIDLLAMIDGHMSEGTRAELTKRLMLISGRSGRGGKRPLEVTVVSREEAVPWRFPPECEYMYGEWLREQVEAGSVPQAGYEPELTVLLWQARISSVPLKGPGITDLTEPIPESDVQKAVRSLLPGLAAGIKGDERNVLLTLARMWFTASTGNICSKDAAAKWAVPRTPSRCAGLLETARRAYVGECEDHWDGLDAETASLAAFLRQAVEESYRKAAGSD